jgi:hypothetical protein
MGLFGSRLDLLVVADEGNGIRLSYSEVPCCVSGDLGLEGCCRGWACQARRWGGGREEVSDHEMEICYVRGIRPLRDCWTRGCRYERMFKVVARTGNNFDRPLSALRRRGVCPPHPTSAIGFTSTGHICPRPNMLVFFETI